MPYVRKPTSDSGNIILLYTILTTGAQDIAAGNLYVLQATLDLIIAILSDYEAAEYLVKVKLQARKKEVRERIEAMAKLIAHCRDTFEVLKRRTSRMDHPLEVLGYYGLPLDGTVPNPGAQIEWLKLARDLIEGNAAAVAAGFPTILNPSVDETQTALDKAQSEFDDVAMADRAYDQAQAAIAVLRARAIELINEVFDQLVFTLRSMDNPSQRRIIRTYGFKYDYAPGEPPEEVPGKCDNFDHLYNEPDLTVSWDKVNTATGYELVYSVDDVNWLPLYIGENNSYTYDPPAGNRYYKVRAKNEIGFGDWSDVIEYEPPVVPV